MNQIVATETMSFKTDRDFFFDSQLDAEEEQEYKVLSRSEAHALEAAMPKVSLWSVLWIQLLAGLVTVVVSAFWGLPAVICATAGVFSAWLPSALFVWRVRAINASKYGSGFSLMSFYFWEAIKIISIIALLAVAMLWIQPLVWQALLAGFVATVKAYSVGCWLSLNKKVKS